MTTIINENILALNQNQNKIGNQISEKIQEDWGTLKHFCKKNSINYHTFRHVLHGRGTSTKISNILIANNYIKNANELIKTNL